MDSLMQMLTDFRLNDPQQALAVRLAAIALIVVIINLSIRILMHRIAKKTDPRTDLIRSVALGIHPSLRAFVYILAVWSAAALVDGLVHLKTAHASVLGKILATAVLVNATWMLKRIVDRVRDYDERKRARTDGGYDDFSALEAIHVAALGAIYIAAFAIFLGIVGVPLAALAGLGVAGGLGAYALTMANQILISNIFAGLVLYFDRPFGPGDWIIAQNGAIEGTVVKIGLRLTVVNGFDQRPIYVPNSIFNTTPTTNASRMKNRRIKQFIGVRYADFPRLEKIMVQIRQYLSEHPGIDQGRVTLVNLVNGSTNMGSSVEGCYGSSSINIQIYTFTKVTNWVQFQNVQDEIMLRIGRIILENGAEIAFPATTLDIPAPLRIASSEPDPGARQAG